MLEIFNTLAYFFEDNYVKISVREFAKFKKISPPHASKLLNFFTFSLSPAANDENE